MMIAMKFYLLTPFLFLGALFLTTFGFSQENISSQFSLITEAPPPTDSFANEHPSNPALKNYPEHSDELETWPHHLERESDTFQVKFFNMLFILILLIGFMMLASWALKRMMKTKMTQLNTANSIKILETRYLSPRATLYLLEVQDQVFLIAESPTSVTYLAKIPLPTFPESNR